MNRSIYIKFKRNVIVLSIVITLIFLFINISLYIINNNYLINKVQEENSAFLELTTHLINENEISVALEYVEHYTHIHEVNIEVTDENNQILFSSDLANKYNYQYQLETLKGNFTIFIDNSDSITVSRIENNTIYINTSLLIIYIISLVVLIRMNKKNIKQINEDMSNVLGLINDQITENNDFNHYEFEKIYNSIKRYLENIDLLTEQKELNIKGLAHDIKTPLTIIYSYFEKVLKNDKLTYQEINNAFESSKKVNELLNEIIENKKRLNNQNVLIDLEIVKKIDEYKHIFGNKNIKIEFNTEKNIMILWNNKDFSRVIDNLFSNAYYYSKNDSIFRIKLYKKRNIFIEFISEPKNIKGFDTNAIFLKGYRGKISKNSNAYGKGLGLYLSSILLSNINGMIKASIENENVKFTIIL